MSETRTASTYHYQGLDGQTHSFNSKLLIAWVVTTEDRVDLDWRPNRFGYYFRTGSRKAAERKAAEARSIPGDHGFARVAIVPARKES